MYLAWDNILYACKTAEDNKLTKFSKQWTFKIVNINIFIFRKAVAVMMSVSFREGYNSLIVAILSSLYLEWDILLLISYRTQEWCWETVALGKSLKLFFCIHTFPFPCKPQFPQSGLWRAERERNERAETSNVCFLTEALQRLRKIWESSVLWMVLQLARAVYV